MLGNELRHPLFVQLAVRFSDGEQVGVGQRRHIRLGEAAQNDVVFLHAAMGCAVDQAFSAGVQDLFPFR